MDRLPPELLKMIADSIEQEIQPFTRQRTLVALARTNKTFYSICNSRIYRNPALGDEQMVKKWTRFYISQVNPWTVCRGSKSFENVIVPRSIKFRKYQRTTNGISSAVPTSQNSKCPTSDTLPLLQNVFSPLFFRNLVSFSASSKSRVDSELVVALVGPNGYNRSSIKKLRLRQDQESMLVMYLLEGYNRMPFDRRYELFDQPLTEPEDELSKQRIKALVEKGEDHMDDSESLELDDLENDLYAAYFSIFRQVWPTLIQSVDIMEEVEETRDVFAQPFASLVSLTLVLPSEVHELYLLFHSGLFPSLKILKLVGQVGFCEPSAYDVKLLRHSITKNRGKIRRPRIERELKTSYPEVFDTSWKPLSAEEMEELPKIDYFGPNLDKLDLSECQFLTVF